MARRKGGTIVRKCDAESQERRKEWEKECRDHDWMGEGCSGTNRIWMKTLTIDHVMHGRSAARSLLIGRSLWNAKSVVDDHMAPTSSGGASGGGSAGRAGVFVWTCLRWIAIDSTPIGRPPALIYYHIAALLTPILLTRHHTLIASG